MKRRAALLIAALLGLGLIVPAQATTAAPTITTLSNRADLISGGDVLVEVGLPPGTGLRALVAGRRDLTRSLRRVDASHFRGLLDGLPVGPTMLTASTTSGGQANLVVTNHPVGGPVFAGPQVQPWTCATTSNGLGPPTDKQCNTAPVVSWQYKSAITGRFGNYDPKNPPAAATIASTTTDQGVHAPYIVKVEQGVMDRGLYTIAVLADPKAWNHKLGSPFGGSCNPRHQQESVDTGPNEFQPTLFSVLDDAKVGKGFMVAHNELGNLGSDCNDVVAAESLMMLEEHIKERYGEIRYTIGYGCSGGSMLQHLIAADYPGLLDGITPACSFPDVWSTVTEAEDCHLLERFFAKNPTWTPAQQAAVAGYQTVGTCTAFEKLPVNSTQSWFDPSYAAGCGSGFQAYDPKTRPRGVRCDIQDYQVAQLGRDAHGFAHRPYDNTGVQYGLQALRAGTITAEQFVSLNEQAGGDDLDWKHTTGRTAADPTGVRNAYLGGRITDGHLLADVPILDLRGSSNQEIHTDYHSYEMRARLDKANGTHANQVIWTSEPLTVDPTSYAQSFFVMDAWLATIEKDHRSISRSRKVILDKPALAVDSCWLAGHQVTDQAACGTAFPHYGDPRLAAGGPVSGGVIACALSPLTRPAGLTDVQWKRLLKVFPRGVCDPRRPGREQVAAVPWMTYNAGSPRPIGPAPRSAQTTSAAPSPWMPAASNHFAVTREATTGLPDHTVLRPTRMQDVPYLLPVIVWGNGGCRDSNEEYHYFLTKFASYGYVIIANGKPENAYHSEELAGIATPTPQKLLDAVSWAIKENSRPSSRYFRRLDTTRIAALGQSCGAWEALSASTDPRIHTTIAWNNGGDPHAGDTSKLRAPTLFVSGGNSDYTLAETRLGYARVPAGVPTVHADNAQAGHTGFWDDPHTAMQDEPLPVAQEWLAFTLYGDARGRGFFLDECALCTRANWTVESKNWTAR